MSELKLAMFYFLETVVNRPGIKLLLRLVSKFLATSMNEKNEKLG